MSDGCDFSLVIPAFNESGRILPTLQRAEDFLGAWGGSYEILVVDDGSTDETAVVCEKFAIRHSCPPMTELKADHFAVFHPGFTRRS